MADQTHISWCDATFNPWVGCAKVSPACDNCYAESWAKRTGHPELWHGARRRTTPAYWRQPIKWNEQARESEKTKRVFCASLADVFDNKVPAHWRVDLWGLIDATPYLTWMLLTKRPQNVTKMMPPAWRGMLPRNVEIGTTIENQEEARRRLPVVCSISAWSRFISVEPMLELINLDHAFPVWRACINLVICGGESGGRARSMDYDATEFLRAQCAQGGASFWFKQIGTNPGFGWPAGITGKGDNPEQWPEQFRGQRMPEPVRAYA